MRPESLLALPGLVCTLLLAACGAGKSPASSVSNATLQEQVTATERAFAATMAARDRDAFANFLDPETIFYSGKDVLRGRERVVAGWASYFEGREAPFSWAPESVQVLDSGTLALSTGLVRDPQGQVTARFTSIWRLDAVGQWRIVFDKGGPP
jgi:ketosteroid isomerase-like protein